MHRLFNCPALVALCLSPFVVAAAETRPALQLVVYTGDRSPIPGATSFFALSIPTANERGTFLFSASNLQENQSYKPALFVSDGSSITPVVTHLDLYQHYTNIYFYAPFALDYSEFRINDAGTVLFQHEIRTSQEFLFNTKGSWPVGVPLTAALWESSGGSPSPIAARLGSGNEFAPPGITLTSGVVPRFERFPEPRVNNNGFYLFSAPINGGNVGHGRALYSGQGGSLSLINWTDNTNGPKFSHARLARGCQLPWPAKR